MGSLGRQSKKTKASTNSTASDNFIDSDWLEA